MNPVFSFYLWECLTRNLTSLLVCCEQHYHIWPQVDLCGQSLSTCGHAHAHAGPASRSRPTRLGMEGGHWSRITSLFTVLLAEVVRWLPSPLDIASLDCTSRLFHLGAPRSPVEEGLAAAAGGGGGPGS